MRPPCRRVYAFSILFNQVRSNAGAHAAQDRNVLGDASLWWRIAEANALALGGDTQLAVGQTLTVPKVALNANSADTLQPYEPGKVIGSQDPVLPVPAAKGCGCGRRCHSRCIGGLNR